MNSFFSSSFENDKGYPLWLVALMFLVVPVALFWRPSFFFIRDDWRTLTIMVENSFGQFLLKPEGEQWFPLFHLIYFTLIKVFADRYSFLIIFTCLATGLNAFLFFLFCRRHLSYKLALILGLGYAVGSAHNATAPMAFYLSFILSLTFFLLALLLTDGYCRAPSPLKLLSVGLCAGCSITCHNYTLPALLILPAYPLLVGTREKRRSAWVLLIVMLVVILLYLWCYFTFAGLSAVSSIRPDLLNSPPPPIYLLHWFAGAIASPFYYLLCNERLPAVTGMAIGGVFFGLLMAVIWWGGGKREKNMVLWTMLYNGLPFLVVSLARSHFSLGQAFGQRYGVFTLVGALFLVGIAWTVLASKIPFRPLTHRILPLTVVGLLMTGQIIHTPEIFRRYQWESRIARETYRNYPREAPKDRDAAEEVSQHFLMTGSDFPVLTRGQISAVRRRLDELRVP